MFCYGENIKSKKKDKDRAGKGISKGNREVSWIGEETVSKTDVGGSR